MVCNIFTKLCNRQHRTFFVHKETLYPLSVIPPSPDCLPKELQIYFLIPWTCLFYTFNVSGIMNQVSFVTLCVLLSAFLCLDMCVSICSSVSEDWCWASTRTPESMAAQVLSAKCSHICIHSLPISSYTLDHL